MDEDTGEDLRCDVCDGSGGEHGDVGEDPVVREPPV